MPTIDFPSSPTLNQTYTFNGRSWKWNGEGWEALPSAAGVPIGGTAGYALIKNSATDYDTKWAVVSGGTF